MNASHTHRTLARIAGLVLVTTLAASAHAQSETRGELLLTEKQMPAAASDYTREQRKAVTLAANHNGGLGSPGQSSYRTYNTSQRDQLAKSTKTRAERKAETMQAVQRHQLMGAGEAS